MIIITRQIEALKSKKTQSDLNLILKKWNWGGKNPTNATEFLDKFAPWINEKIKLSQEVDELLKRKGVNNLKDIT